MFLKGKVSKGLTNLLIILQINHNYPSNKQNSILKINLLIRFTIFDGLGFEVTAFVSGFAVTGFTDETFSSS